MSYKKGVGPEKACICTAEEDERRVGCTTNERYRRTWRVTGAMGIVVGKQLY
jgi:hypothetical protein